jgi:hypothetical protein
MKKRRGSLAFDETTSPMFAKRQDLLHDASYSHAPAPNCNSLNHPPTTSPLPSLRPTLEQAIIVSNLPRVRNERGWT